MFRIISVQNPIIPVQTEESLHLFALYRDLAEHIPNLIVCGCLGDFKYYNMDQALYRALKLNLCFNT